MRPSLWLRLTDLSSFYALLRNPFPPVALAVLGALLAAGHLSASQESRFAKDKAGAWKIGSRIRSCGSSVDVAAFTRNVTGVAEWFHQNDAVVAPPKGFDAEVSLRGDGCPTEEPTGPEFHGTRGAVSFAFLYFYLEKGVVKTATAWSAHDTEVHINDPAYCVGHRLDEHGWEPGDNPALREPLEKEIAPGVDLYRDGTVVVSNPSRPPFWIPVTMCEVMDASVAPGQLDRPAFATNGEDGPECWDRRLPTSAIQFVTFRYVPQSEDGLKEYIVLNGGLSNCVGLFYNALPVERLGAVIGRQ